MKKRLPFLVLVILLFACEQAKKTSNCSNQIDQLAKRYQALGRFSGTILITQAHEILFRRSYGFADYENQVPFSDTTIFKIGKLTQVFTDHVTEKLGIRYEDDTIFQKVLEKYYLKQDLEHTFYQRENTVLANGYLFHNHRGQGLELEKSMSYEIEKGFSSYGLKSTVNDLLKFAQLLPDVLLQKSGYLSKDGFSYAFQKSKNRTIIILSNRRHPIAEEMATSIQAIYNNEPYELPLLRLPFAANTNLYTDYIGIYQINQNFNFEVLAKNNRLFTVMGNQQTPIIPQSDHQFYYQKVDAAIRFVSDSNQVVSKAILYDGFLKGQEAKKVK